MKTTINSILISTLLLLISSCEPYVDPVIAETLETRDLLQENNWVITDYQIEVINDDIPPPLLLGFGNDSIRAGHYNLKDMIDSGEDFPIYRLKFTDGNDVLVDSTGSGKYEDNGSTYFVFNNSRMRLKTHGIGKLPYTYSYDPNSKSMRLTTTAADASKLIEDATQKFIDDAVKGTPNKIGDAIAKLLSDPIVQQKIHDALKAALAGKIQGWLDSWDPEDEANKISEKIMEWLESKDWQQILSDAINKELQKLLDFDADSVAAEMAKEIADKIAEKYSVENIYNAIYPYLNEFDKLSPEEMADQMAQAVLNLLGNVFSQNNLEKIIYPIWLKFTQLSDDQITALSEKLTEAIQERWLNEENLTNLFLPITQKIDETSIFKMGELADEATDDIKTLVDELNSLFPGLGLDPDYDTLNKELKAAFIAAKPLIAIQGPEAVAQSIADLILDNFLTVEKIEQAFETALHDLQEIDPQTAADAIATFLVELEGKIAPELYDWLVEKLTPIMENFDPEATAARIAEALNKFITDIFSEDNLEPVIDELLKKLQGINTEELANLIAKKILDSPWIKENITQEHIAELLYPILLKIHNLNAEELAEELLDKLAPIIKDIFTAERVSKIIAFIIYKIAYDNLKIANNFEEATIIIEPLTIEHE